MSQTFTYQQFVSLMQQLAQAWGEQDTRTAVSCFTHDAVYMQPPNLQFYQGHEQLSAYFGALESGTYLHYQNTWFDEDKQVGCVEFTFGVVDRSHADHGTIIVELQDGLIAHWREYVQKGIADFGEFRATNDKNWQWHIGNYP